MTGPVDVDEVAPRLGAVGWRRPVGPGVPVEPGPVARVLRRPSGAVPLVPPAFVEGPGAVSVVALNPTAGGTRGWQGDGLGRQTGVGYGRVGAGRGSRLGVPDPWRSAPSAPRTRVPRRRGPGGGLRPRRGQAAEGSQRGGSDPPRHRPRLARDALRGEPEARRGQRARDSDVEERSSAG